MRRGSNSLLIILAVLLLAGTGALAYFFLSSGSATLGTQADLLPPTPRPEQAVVQAVIDITAGSVLNTTEVLKVAMISGDVYAANPDEYFTSMDELKGMKAAQDLTGGKPIMRSAVSEAGLADIIPTTTAGQEAIRAFPIQVDALTGVADMIQMGDYVDIMASFNQEVVSIRPAPIFTSTTSIQGTGERYTEDVDQAGNTKVLLQDVQVLKVVKPAPPAPDQTVTPEPEPEPVDEAQAASQTPKNTLGTVLQSGKWTLIVAVTNQEAEVLRFVLDNGIGISTLLRATGDHETQRTVGATMRILVDNYSMPIASAMQPAQHIDAVLLPTEPVESYAPQIPTPTGEAVKAGSR